MTLQYRQGITVYIFQGFTNTCFPSKCPKVTSAGHMLGWVFCCLMYCYISPHLCIIPVDFSLLNQLWA